MTDYSVPSQSTRGPKFFAGIGGLLLLAVVVPSPTRIALWSEQSVTTPSIRLPEAARGLTQSDLAVVAERPLFNVGRKKDPPTELNGEEYGLNGYRLAGVIATGSTGIAFVERKQTKVTTTLKVGDVLDERTVSAISNEGVKFTGPGGVETLGVPKPSGATIAAGTTQKPSATK